MKNGFVKPKSYDGLVCWDLIQMIKLAVLNKNEYNFNNTVAIYRNGIILSMYFLSNYRVSIRNEKGFSALGTIFDGPLSRQQERIQIKLTSKQNRRFLSTNLYPFQLKDPILPFAIMLIENEFVLSKYLKHNTNEKNKKYYQFIKNVVLESKQKVFDARKLAMLPCQEIINDLIGIRCFIKRGFY